MPCSCQTPTSTPTGEPLPLISDACPENACTALSQCCTDPESLPSAISDGATLPAWATDAGCYDTGVTLLGRVGNKLARLIGSGFLQLTNGQVSVVTSVPLKVSNLWHRWWKTSPTSRPIIGEPLDFPLHIVSDCNGNLHAIKGGTEEDSQHVWDYNAASWKTVPLSEIVPRRKGLIERTTGLEITGFVPIPLSSPSDSVRYEKVLRGEGLVVLTEQDTVFSDALCGAGCTPTAGEKASLATVLDNPVPVADEVYVLKYSAALGMHWVEEV